MPGRVQRRSKVRPLARVLPSGSVPSKEAPHGPAWRPGGLGGLAGGGGLVSAAARLRRGILDRRPCCRCLGPSLPLLQCAVRPPSSLFAAAAAFRCRRASRVILGATPDRRAGPAGACRWASRCDQATPRTLRLSGCESSPKTQDVVVRSGGPSLHVVVSAFRAHPRSAHARGRSSTFRGGRPRSGGLCTGCPPAAGVVHGSCTG